MHRSLNMQDVNRLKYESALQRHFSKTLNWMHEKRLKVLGLIQRNRWNSDLNPHIAPLQVHFRLKCNSNTSDWNQLIRDLQTNDPGIRIRDRCGLYTPQVRVEPRRFAVGSTSVPPSWVKNKLSRVYLLAAPHFPATTATTIRSQEPRSRQNSTASD